jgi:hypothetical protein
MNTKKAQWGIRKGKRQVIKEPGGRNITSFYENPFTGASMMVEKDIEKKTKESPRRVYKHKYITTSDGQRKEVMSLKEKGKVLKKETINVPKDVLEKQKKGGKTMMLKRKDGSVSQRGLWDNLRSKAAQNKKTGAKPKAPTTAMLKQERKIKAQTKKK